MKKPRLAKKFLEEIERVPIVSVVCEKLNVSRQTIYRWKKEDAEFDRRFNAALSMGRDGITDLAESKLISHINNGNMRAIDCWLSNNAKRYFRTKSPDVPPDEPLTLTDFIKKAIQKPDQIDAGNSY